MTILSIALTLRNVSFLIKPTHHQSVEKDTTNFGLLARQWLGTDGINSGLFLCKFTNNKKESIAFTERVINFNIQNFDGIVILVVIKVEYLINIVS